MKTIHLYQIMNTVAMRGMEPKPWGRSGLCCRALISP